MARIGLIYKFWELSQRNNIMIVFCPLTMASNDCHAISKINNEKTNTCLIWKEQN